MKKIVIASSNPGKLREFGALFVDRDISIVPQKEFGIGDADECGLSFVENAIIKARHAASQTNLPAIADDSGLEVDAIPDELGIFSARFGGEGFSDQDKNALLLKKLDGVPFEKRTARFVSLVVFYNLDKTYYSFEGSREGMITESPKGNNGFGYDPIFYLPNLKCSIADLSQTDKNNISHRSIAFRKFKDWYMNVFTKEV